MDELLDLVFGNHPQRQKLKPSGKRVLEELRAGEKSVQELSSSLNLDLTKSAEKKRFYTLLRPFKDKGMVSNRRAAGKAYYYLSYDGFRYYLDRMRKAGEYWLKKPA